MTRYETVLAKMSASPRRWLVTGAAGFIGSNLMERLLMSGQTVVALDNFATGHKRNFEDVRDRAGETAWRNAEFVEGDITNLETCREACAGVDYILHQAALGSVPRSIKNPVATNESNVTGFVNMLHAAQQAGIKRFVFASSSSVYGDHPALPKVEEQIGSCLSPYAVSKRVNELYADVFSRCYEMEYIGLRYFNVFGPRQDPNGPYAAVIPKWIAAMMSDGHVQINGDGETSRDFCYVANAVQANLLAATTSNSEAVNQVYNVAVGARTTLKELFEALRSQLLPRFSHLQRYKAHFYPFRGGDVRHSQADISKAERLLEYEPSHRLEEGVQEALCWYESKTTDQPEQGPAKLQELS